MIFFQLSIQGVAGPKSIAKKVSLCTVATPKTEMEGAPSQAEAVVHSTKVFVDIMDAYVIVLAYCYDVK